MPEVDMPEVDMPEVDMPEVDKEGLKLKKGLNLMFVIPQSSAQTHDATIARSHLSTFDVANKLVGNKAT
jgi:hypothetical protein